MVTLFAPHQLVNGGQLAPNVEGAPPAWIVPPVVGREPNLPYVYVVSFIRHHKRSFAAPVSHFMWGLCYHYGVELHNFAPDAISGGHLHQRLRGVPGDPSELGPLGAPISRGAAHSRHERDTSRELYPPCTMMSNLRSGSGGGFTFTTMAPASPYTGKVLKEKTDTWHHGVSPPSHPQRLESLTDALRSLADVELGAASVLANTT
jgi:hypothetical protein